MLLVGLTGGIASGKSLVCRILEELGARTIDADQVSRDMVAPGSDAWNAIARDFGSEFLNSDDTLNRKKMADLIFADPRMRIRLESILHPRIGDEIANRIKQYSTKDPSSIIVVDAALMIEIGKHEDFDKVIVVYADEQSRVDRMVQRDGLSRSDAYRRILSQMPLENKLDLADYVIDNSGSMEDTRRQTVKVFNLLRSCAESHPAEADSRR